MSEIVVGPKGEMEWDPDNKDAILSATGSWVYRERARNQALDWMDGRLGEAMKLSEALMADKSVKVSKGDAEERRQVVYEGYTFQISRGHAYKDHATGPATNPRFSGPDKSVEKAIMDDAILRIKADKIPKVTGIASPGTGVLVHGVPIRYNLVRIKKGKGGSDFMYMISDYMVWQGDPGELGKF